MIYKGWKNPKSEPSIPNISLIPQFKLRVHSWKQDTPEVACKLLASLLGRQEGKELLLKISLNFNLWVSVY